MTNTASAREKALFDMTQSFSKSENELRGALTRATDALYTCELQKASIEAACLDAIGKMQQQLEQETRVWRGTIVRAVYCCCNCDPCARVDSYMNKRK